MLIFEWLGLCFKLLCYSYKNWNCLKKKFLSHQTCWCFNLNLEYYYSFVKTTRFSTVYNLPSVHTLPLSLVSKLVFGDDMSQLLLFQLLNSRLISVFITKYLGVKDESKQLSSCWLQCYIYLQYTVASSLYLLNFIFSAACVLLGFASMNYRS